MPCAAWVAEMPSRPISVAVSKPRPNRKPSGYMCHERETTRKIGRNRRASRPRPASRASSSSSPICSPRRARMNAAQTPRRMNRLARPMTSRNSAETAVPMTPPMSCEAIEPALQAAAVTAIATEARTTMVEWPSEKKKPTAVGLLAFLHQLADDVVDGGDVVGIEGVPQAERVGEERDAEQRRPIRESDPCPGPGREVADQQHAVGESPPWSCRAKAGRRTDWTAWWECSCDARRHAGTRHGGSPRPVSGMTPKALS